MDVLQKFWVSVTTILGIWTSYCLATNVAPSFKLQTAACYSSNYGFTSLTVQDCLQENHYGGQCSSPPAPPTPPPFCSPSLRMSAVTMVIGDMPHAWFAKQTSAAQRSQHSPPHAPRSMLHGWGGSHSPFHGKFNCKHTHIHTHKTCLSAKARLSAEKHRHTHGAFFISMVYFFSFVWMPETRQPHIVLQWKTTPDLSIGWVLLHFSQQDPSLVFALSLLYETRNTQHTAEWPHGLRLIV